MKFGIIGAGMIGNFHAKAITEMNGGTLHSVFDLRAEGAERLASQYGVKAYSDIDAFLSDPELEIVTIGTPSGAHLDPALAALNAGKHVICEKPLEINPARIDEMMEAAKANGKTLAAVLNRRFHPALEAFKGAAEAGRFGKITSASCYVKWWRTQEYYDSGAWRGTWALDGGGALMNQSIHTVDTLLHIAGPVKAVRASMGLIAHERIEVEDIVVATLEFESGAMGVIEATTAAWSSTGHPARVQVCGTQGSVFLADEAFDLGFAVADQPQRHRLHAAGRARARQLAPENGREGEADEIIEGAAGQIGIDQRHVDFARLGHGRGHRILGDGVEDDALDRGVLLDGLLRAEHVEHMPGNGFAFTIGVGGEDQAIGALERAGNVGKALAGGGIDLPGHGKVLVGADRTILGRQIADMAERGQDLIARTQIFVDCLGFSRTFNDDDLHGLPVPQRSLRSGATW